MASVIGMMVLGSATSLVTVFLGLELLSIALYIACGFVRHRQPLAGGGRRSTCSSEASRARSCFTAWRSSTARQAPPLIPDIAQRA